MLVAPRALLTWALALLDVAPKALVFRETSLLGICRLPILVPLLLRFAPALFTPARCAEVAPGLFGRAPAFEPVRFVGPPPRVLEAAPAFEAGRFAAVVFRLVVLTGCLLFAPCCCRVDAELSRTAPP